MNIKLQFHYDIFKQLLRAKFINMRSVFIDKFINVYIWAGCTMLVSGYLMQSFGLTDSFGPFQFGGILSAIGLFDLYANSVTFVSDIEGDRAIAYYLTLPTNALTVLSSYIFYWATSGVLMGIAILPLAKLILWNRLSLAAIAWPKLLFFIVLINLVFATSTLLLSALVPSMDKFDVLWVRFIFPLWFLGGFQFSWSSVYSTAPLLSYLMLLNPVTYTTEGVRAALLGQDGYIPFWLCSTVLILMLIGIIFWAFKALKNRLDFV